MAIAFVTAAPAPTAARAGDDFVPRARTGPRSLGGAPVCEASAIVRVECPGRGGSCWLVGDDEVRSRLFLYQMEPDGSPRVASRLAVDLAEVLEPKKRLSDVEALARLRDGEVLVYGSHSPDKDCKAKAARRRYVGLRLGGSAGEPQALPGRVALVRSAKELRWSDVLGVAPDGVLGRLDAVARATELAADSGDCADAWDVEGATAIPHASGDDVWLGLRRPLLGEDGVLVRHDVAAGALRAVEARTVATGGAGIRALGYDRDARAEGGGWVYGLSPPPRGSTDEAFRLWRFPAAALAQPAATHAVAIETVASVAPRSEGVALAIGSGGRVAVIVQDGKRGPSDTSPCEVDSTFELIPLARPHTGQAAPPRPGAPAASPGGSTAFTPPK